WAVRAGPLHEGGPNISRPFGLIRRAAEIEMQTVSFLLYDGVNAHRPFQVDAVIVDETLLLETAVLPFGDRGLDLCCRHFQQAIEAVEDFFLAKLADEFLEAPFAKPVGAELPADVAEHELRGAAVGADEPLE